MGEGRLSATVLLPRAEVIVRHLMLPGVAGKDLEAAVSYQIDTLHPYGEDEAVSGWSPLGGGAVLLGIVRRPVLDRYVELFAEAGVVVASFTFSAAAVHGALRLFGAPPAAGFVAASAAPAAVRVEIYGESPARAVFSAEFDVPVERAAMLGAAELRLPPRRTVCRSMRCCPSRAAKPPAGSPPRAHWYMPPHWPRRAPGWPVRPTCCRPRCGIPARASCSCPRPYWPACCSSLASPPWRTTGWRIALIFANWKRRSLASSPRPAKPPRSTGKSSRRNSRARLLDEFHARTRRDLDALNELTRLLPPPIWTSGIDLTRETANLNGEAEQAVGLIKVIDTSRCFHNSEPTVLARTGANELFRIRTTRREGCK